jgi:uncharacterized protein (UPF0332 family)
MRGIPDKKSIIKLRIEKAYKTKEGIDFLIKRGYLSFAMDRIYYAGFYVVNALALSDGKHFSKHHQLIGNFNKEYLKNNIIDRTIGVYSMTLLKEETQLITMTLQRLQNLK